MRLLFRACLAGVLTSPLACTGGGNGGAGSSSEATGTSPTDAMSTLTSATTEVSTSTDGSTSAPGSSSGADSSTGDDGPPQELAPLCEGGLPFTFERPDVGEPIDEAALQAATGRYLELLEGVQFFDVVDGRVHGWPQDDPKGRYWFGTWWSGVTIVKQDGEITFVHDEDGADNNGLRTGPLLEGLCYATALWQQPEHEMLVSRMARGLSAWMRAAERSIDDLDKPILIRAFYPESISTADNGRPLTIDYSLNRPGIDASPSAYVHIAANPDWGDVWIKNKRSKDDIGHMLRAVGQLGACAPSFADVGASAAFDEVRTRYSDWSRKVEDDGWHIATLDAEAELWFPDDLLAYFVEAECTAKLALRLLGRFDAGDLECGNGIGPFDAAIIAANDHNGNILRSFHEAAVNNALLAGQDELALALLGGLAERIAQGMDGFDGTADPVPWLGETDLVGMMSHGAAAGVPLTSREVRWLHAQIEVALASYVDNPNLLEMIQVFEESTPDGEYGYEPYGDGINFVDLAGLLGTCASPCVNPSARPVLDCAMVEAWVP